MAIQHDMHVVHVLCVHTQVYVTTILNKYTHIHRVCLCANVCIQNQSHTHGCVHMHTLYVRVYVYVCVHLSVRSFEHVGACIVCTHTYHTLTNTYTVSSQK